MKKIDVSAIGGTTGMPVKSGSLLHLQSAYTELFAAVLKMLNSGVTFTANTVYILYGCKNSTVAPIYTLSAGAVLYNDEIFFVDAVTFTSPGGEVAVASIDTTFFSAPNADPVTFTDAIARSVHQIRKILISSANTGTGIADFSAFKNFSGEVINYTILSSDLVVGAGAYTIVGGQYKYSILGKYLRISVFITLTSAATTNTFFQFKLPAGVLVQGSPLEATVGYCTGDVNSFLTVDPLSSLGFIRVGKVDASAFAAFPVGTDIRFTATIAIQ